MIGPLLSKLRSPRGRDALLTTLTEGLAMLGMIYAYHLAARTGTEDLDLYVITRRTVSFAYPVILMGSAVGLTRFVAMSRDPGRQRAYLRGVMTYIFPLGLLFFLSSALFHGPLAWFVFGNDGHSDLLLPLGLMIFGVSLHGTVYSYLRGRGLITLANVIQFFDLAAAPCLAFLFFDDLEHVLWATGLTWALVAAAVMLPELLAPGTPGHRRERAQLLRFGLPRVPGDLALGALLTVPVYVAARTHGLPLSGQVGFGATLLNIAAALFTPLTLLLLPAAAGQLASGDHAGLAKRIRRVAGMSVVVSAMMLVGFELLVGPMLHVYLGEGYMDYVPMSRLIFLGALPFGFFYALRSVLDAYFHTPRNGVNLTLSFGILLLGAAVHLAVPTPPQTMGVVLVIALYYLGWATWRDTRFVLSELERFARKAGQPLRVAVVIADGEGGVDRPDTRRQAEVFSRDHGAQVSTFFLDRRSSPGRLLIARRNFKKMLRRERPDVVHVRAGSVAALFTVLSSAVPVVVHFDDEAVRRGQAGGRARNALGRAFTQSAAFFASGIICTDEVTRDRLWWRADEARIIPVDGRSHDRETLEVLRATAMHAPSEA